MFKNYIRISLRNLTKFKTLSLINILGLAVGIGCAVLISLLVIDELSYERFHTKAKEIYRIVSSDYIGTPAALAPALERNLPEISETVRLDNFTRRTKKLFSYNDKRFYEERFILAEPSIFKIFSFTFLSGSSDISLNNPNSILMTETTAKKYFGDEDPIGKVITLENNWDFTVTGIIKDIPENTHLKFDLLAPFIFNEKEERYGKNIHQNWGQSNFVTYFLVSNESTIEKSILEKEVNRVNNESGGARYKRQFFLQSFSDIHLKSNLAAEFEANSSVSSVVFYSVIGLIVLLIACLNSMNLSTARSIKRAKEVGIRKVVGADRSQLITQFFGESFVTSIISLFIALLLVALVLPTFNSLTGKQLSLINSPFSVFIVLILAVVITGVGSGLYPALFLSAFQPVKAFKSKMLPKSDGALLRKILVVAQFSLSIIFLVCTFVVWKQLNFIKKKDLGFNKEYIVNIPLPQEVQEKYEIIKNAIKEDPKVLNAAASNFPSISPYNHGMYWEGKTDDDDKSMLFFGVDFDFIDTMQIEVVEGRNFSRDFSTDTITAYIFNEAAVNEFGKDFIEGRRISLFGQDEVGPVIGIAKNFNFMSLHEEVRPLALCVYPRYFNHISVRVDSQNIPSVLNHLRTVWGIHVPNRPFEYFFLDDRFDRMYRSEQRLGKIFSYFAVLAIFISCLGLFALASFMAEQRTKEIGVRKVLGASLTSITFLLSKEFLKLVLLANIIAWPASYLVMKKWLDNFAYRYSIGLEIFFLSGFIALTIAILTVSYQSIKTALLNPIDTLRYE